RKVDSGTFYEETRQYNQFNFLLNLTVKNVEVDGSATDLLFTFDPDNAYRLQTIHYPGGTTRTFSYDHLGHVTKMQLTGNGSSYTEDYGRDVSGNLTELKQGGQQVRTFSYD